MGLHDPALFPRDLLERVAQNAGVVEVKLRRRASDDEERSDELVGGGARVWSASSEATI